MNKFKSFCKMMVFLENVMSYSLTISKGTAKQEKTFTILWKTFPTFTHGFYNEQNTIMITRKWRKWFGISIGQGTEKTEFVYSYTAWCHRSHCSAILPCSSSRPLLSSTQRAQSVISVSLFIFLYWNLFLATFFCKRLQISEQMINFGHFFNCIGEHRMFCGHEIDIIEFFCRLEHN